MTTWLDRHPRTAYGIVYALCVLMLGLLALGWNVAAFAQPTCAAAIPDPVPRDAVRLSWGAPTTNTDGSPIKTPIDYTVYEGSTAKCVIRTTLAASLTSLSVGAHSYFVTAKTVDGESAKTGPVTKTILSAPPNAPTNLQVDPASLVAYTIVQSTDRIALVAVGTVAPGTACDGTQGVNGMYVVPLASVTWAGTVRPRVVVAPCIGG